MLFGRWLRIAALLLLVGGLAGVWYKLRKAPDERQADNRRSAQPAGPEAGHIAKAHAEAQPARTHNQGTGASPSPTAAPVAMPATSGTGRAGTGGRTSLDGDARGRR